VYTARGGCVPRFSISASIVQASVCELVALVVDEVRVGLVLDVLTTVMGRTHSPLKQVTPALQQYAPQQVVSRVQEPMQPGQQKEISGQK
jgi:hypothetical protein